MSLQLKRIYVPASDDDGLRILVDRLWPRGVSKYDAALAEWMKDAAPSPELRTWFGHDPARWAEFRKRYQAELKDNPCVETLREMAARDKVTLVYGARDEQHNHALVLAEAVRG
ncbi:MAG: hypothetical protein BGP16_03705 [Sphingobium sp. 66-54]|nr:MAG: hypothetical protein BGP16_03705 [Sphingobium sp. 66-54]